MVCLAPVDTGAPHLWWKQCQSLCSGEVNDGLDYQLGRLPQVWQASSEAHNSLGDLAPLWRLSKGNMHGLPTKQQPVYQGIVQGGVGGALHEALNAPAPSTILSHQLSVNIWRGGACTTADAVSSGC